VTCRQFQVATTLLPKSRARKAIHQQQQQQRPVERDVRGAAARGQVVLHRAPPAVPTSATDPSSETKLCSVSVHIRHRQLLLLLASLILLSQSALIDALLRLSATHYRKLSLIQYNIRLLEAVRTQRRTIIEREKYVENENVKMVHNE